MQKIVIPGWGTLQLEEIVLDLNGTTTESGNWISGVQGGIKRLVAFGYGIHVLSGDTRGTLQQMLADMKGCTAHPTANSEEKRSFVESIGPERTVAVGNGNIDLGMFEIAALSICTIQGEGATTKALLHSDIVVTHISHAFHILLDPDKLIATLRS